MNRATLVQEWLESPIIGYIIEKVTGTAPPSFNTHEKRLEKIKEECIKASKNHFVLALRQPANALEPVYAKVADEDEQDDYARDFFYEELSRIEVIPENWKTYHTEFYYFLSGILQDDAPSDIELYLGKTFDEYAIDMWRNL